MTTIAWDGKLLAADRRVSFGSVSDMNHSKIVKRKDGALCGTAGVTSMAAAFRRWFMAGEKGERPGFGKGEDSVNAVIVRPDGTFVFHDEYGWYDIDSPYFAIGSGANFALGAMAMGASAGVAVHIASKFDGSTGDVTEALTPGKENVRKQV